MMSDRLFFKATRPDLRTRNGYRWAFPGSGDDLEARGLHVDRSPDLIPNTEEGWTPGLWVAKTIGGASAGGHGLATLLLVAVADHAVLAEDEHKARISAYRTIDVVDGWRLIRRHGRNANLWGADLTGADLTGADLREANLRGADLRGVDLWDADLREANLREANLGYADLTGADLREAHRGGVLWDRRTLWPAGFTPHE